MFIKSFLIVLLLIPVIFVLWMNLTPGYFQMVGCNFGYFTDEKIIKLNHGLPSNLTADCLPTNFSKLLLYSARLDFNKGNGSGGPNEPQPIPAPEDKSGAEGSFCGGLSNTSLENQCPLGYTCQLVNNYPDASGKCVSSSKQPSPAYICPKTEWVDCMPGPGPAKPDCQKEYLSWATNNCPNFKGAAL